jgi:hypothetical protein
LLDQVHILLRRGDAFLRFLLKGMQPIDVPAKQEGHHRANCLAVMPNGDFEDAAADSFERLGILRQPAILQKLEFATDGLPGLRRERLNTPRIPQTLAARFKVLNPA